MGTTPPPVLDRYLTERAFWKELGLRSDVPLEDRPHLELAEYKLITSLIQREEARQAAQNR